MKKIVIITGANGFLGNNIIRMLDKNKYEIRALYHSNCNNIDDLECFKYQGDILEAKSLDKVFENPSNREIIVIHTAAIIYLGKKYDQKVFDANVKGTKNIVKKCLEYNAKLIYVNSVDSIPKGVNPIVETSFFDQEKVKDLYAKTKAIAAKYVLEKVHKDNLDAVIIHPSSIIGPYNYSNDYLVEMIKMVANKDLTFAIKGGYDFVDVRDVSQGIINAIDKGTSGECYILSGKYYKVIDLLNLVCDACSIEEIKHKIPLVLVYMSLPFVSIYYKIKKKIPLFSYNSIRILQENINFSHEKATKELNYNPRDLSITINDTVKWLKENNKL